MASHIVMNKRMANILDEVYETRNNADKDRKEMHAAALIIQSCWRGAMARKKVQFVNYNATMIAKLWRGHSSRRAFKEILKMNVLRMKKAFYDRTATKIQKTWRGFYSRKYVFDYYKRKDYLLDVERKNSIVRQELLSIQQKQLQEREKEENEKYMQKLQYLARKYHFLVSTEAIPGIFNAPFKPYPDHFEMLLRNSKPLEHPKPEGPRTSTVVPLPPLGPKIQVSPQGPFRSAEDVLKQRYRPFNPSLRVQTSYFALEEAREMMKAEEWVGRVNDDVFIPVSKPAQPYDPLMHTQTPYPPNGALPYGTKYFRVEEPAKHVAPQRFRTLVPPVPQFDKLNQTYSQGEV